MSVKGKSILAACAALALAMGAAAWGDPPERVGRLNLIEGRVSFKPGDLEEWTAATRNYPLTAGDSLWAEPGARAELHVGSTAIRLGAETELSFLELDDENVQVSLTQGLLHVRLRELEPGEGFEIDTPTLSLSVLEPGSYRVEVGEEGGSRAAVKEGRAEVLVAGQAYPLRAGQAASVAASPRLSLQIAELYAQDEWDRWVAERDRREDRLVSTQYVPRTMIGCEDLDWYGSWSVSVEYGPVWAPRSLPAGWAPYRQGHWAWVQPWGWTWIDDMPWGFAPFHYGRWALLRGRWVWAPGAIVRRPVYAPALVVFVELGPGGPALDGRIGWFPLGPREPYLPAYRVSPGYLRKVNVAHVRIAEQETIDPARVQHAYRQQPQAYTVVSRQFFPQARPVRDGRVVVQEREIPQAQVRGAAAPVAPQRESVLGAPRAQREVPRPPQGVQQRKVFVRNEPSASPAPFAEQGQKPQGQGPQQGQRQQGQKPQDQGPQAPRQQTSPRWIKQPSEPQARQGQPVPQQPRPQQSPQVRKEEPQGRQAEPQVRQGQPGGKQSTPQRKKVWKKKILPNGQEVWVEE